MRLPDYHRQILPDVIQASGVVKQQVLHNQGPYLTGAELAGMRAGREGDQWNRRVVADTWGGIKTAATLVAAGLGAAGVFGAEAAVTAPALAAATDVAAINGELAGIGAGAVGTVAAPAAITAPVTVAAKGASAVSGGLGTVGEAMARAAFPQISGAYDSGAAYAKRSVGQLDKINGTHRVLQDVEGIDRAVADIMMSTPLEEQPAAIDALFRDNFSEAYSTLAPGAYNLYYEKLEQHKIATINNVIMKAGEQIKTDDYNLKAKSLSAAIMARDEAAALSVIDVLENGDPDVGDPRERIIHITPQKAEQMRIAVRHDIAVNNVKAQLSELPLNGRIEALLAMDEENKYVNFKNLLPSDRDALLKDAIGNRDASEKQAEHNSKIAAGEIFEQEPLLLSGAVDFELEMKKRDPAMNGNEERDVRAWWRALNDGPAVDTKKGMLELSKIYIAVANGETSPEAGRAGASKLASDGLITAPTLKQGWDYLEDSTMLESFSDIEKAVTDYAADDKNPAGLTGEQQAEVTAELVELSRNPEYSKASAKDKEMMKQEVIANELNKNIEHGVLNTILHPFQAYNRYVSANAFDGETFEAESWRPGDQNKNIESYLQKLTEGRMTGLVVEDADKINAVIRAGGELYEKDFGHKPLGAPVLIRGLPFFRGDDGSMYVPEVVEGRHGINNKEVELRKLPVGGERTYFGEETAISGDYLPPVMTGDNGDRLLAPEYIYVNKSYRRTVGGNARKIPIADGVFLTKPEGVDSWHLVNKESHEVDVIPNPNQFIESVGLINPNTRENFKTVEEIEKYLDSLRRGF